ncbi:MAG: hypothetical protein LBK60_03310 [Verrucomicrobiales bacterium]|jgi:uncharacterized protein (DUF608 family)|nr:hypothetical protein [Verrucomicrobiales bacterium]
MFVYDGQRALQVAMPVGGIGTGNVSLAGNGAIEDFSLYHQPLKTAMPDGHEAREAAFGLLHVRGKKPVTRLLEGPLPPEKIYCFGLKAQGFRHGGQEGMPRFAKSKFVGEFPFGHVHLSDPKVPLAVTLTAFNPYIPLDDKNSGIPCAILEYTFTNRSRQTVTFDFVYSLSHLAVGKKSGWRGASGRAVAGRGVLFTNDETADSETFGSAALYSLGPTPVIKSAWFRGGWFDALSALWREVDEERFAANDGGGSAEGRPGGSILFKGKLKPGQAVTYPLVFTWYVPNVYWQRTDQELTAPPEAAPFWQPYYAGQWRDAGDVAEYVRAHYASLRARTLAFKDALFGSTLPPAVLDAVSANLGILKSPTVLRQKNGNLWAWEGCGVGWGSCAGTCTHVWNYAQAMPHLFPRLERGIREQELLRSMAADGHVNFRAALPDGPRLHNFHAAADGQLGGIMKVWREWQISGDEAWLRKMWPQARLSLEFCIGQWDPDRKGVLVEPHHNTYDIEFWGPDGMCNTIYLGALSAAAEMAAALSADADAAEYRRLSAAGARFLDTELFNGEYYYQKVRYRELRDRSFAQLIAKDADDDEALALLKKEGPKYQYGTGCLSDGVIGAWMAALYGIKTPLNRANVRRALAAIYRHNFRRDLSEHVNLQRPGYALGHEAGLLLCSWPRGGKPTLPFVYSDEVWTGIEYQVAAHLILEGKVKEGLNLVQAARSRYDGRARNPYDEYECGSYYARAMASYALLAALSGYRYSAVSKTLWFGPRTGKLPFKVFFSAANGYGTLTLTKNALTMTMLEGTLPVDKLVLTIGGKTKTLTVNLTASVEMPAVVKY